MALNKQSLKQAIKQAFADQAEKTEDPDAALDDLAGKIADAVDDYVKGATIMANPSQVAAGTLMAGAYPVVAAGNIISSIN